MIRKRGSKYYYTISVVDSQGVKRRIERVGGSTKAECKLAEARAIAQYAQEPMDTTPPLMFHSFLDEWHRDYATVNLSENTAHGYRHTINIIKKRCKDKRLADVTQLDLQKFINSLIDEYSRSTIKLVVAVLHTSMKYAVSPCEYISKDPAYSLRVPRNVPHAQPREAFEDADGIIEAAKGTPIYFALSLLYHTGCRVGEIIALKWKDVDMDKRVIFIHTTALKGRRIQDYTKSFASTRTIPFSYKVYEILLAIRAEQEKNRQLTQRQYPFVCSNPIGESVSLRSFYYHWAKLKKSLGIEQTPHCFRHTHATKLLEMGADIDMVSKRLGHSSIATTSSIYSHVTEKRNNQLINLLDNF